MKWLDYFDMWFTDKEEMLSTMVKNMQADLDAGYNYFGNSITKQRAAIDRYKKGFDDQMKKFYNMNIDKIGRWCYYDMKRRGIISL